MQLTPQKMQLTDFGVDNDFDFIYNNIANGGTQP